MRDGVTIVSVTLRRALAAGKRFIGIERDARHFATTVERIIAAWAKVEAAAA